MSINKIFKITATIVPPEIPEEKRAAITVGSFATMSGLIVIPIPTPIPPAIIIKFLDENLALDRACMPEPKIVPNIRIPAPPRIGVGIIETRVANFGQRLIIIKINEEKIATFFDAHFVSGISPTF